MAQYRAHRAKPWKARISWAGKEQFIGYFATQEEAECAEYDHGRRLPGVVRCDCGYPARLIPEEASGSEYRPAHRRACA